MGANDDNDEPESWESIPSDFQAFFFHSTFYDSMDSVLQRGMNGRYASRCLPSLHLRFSSKFAAVQILIMAYSLLPRFIYIGLSDEKSGIVP